MEPQATKTGFTGKLLWNSLSGFVACAAIYYVFKKRCCKDPSSKQRKLAISAPTKRKGPRATNSRKKAPRHAVVGFTPFVVTENADDYRDAIVQCVRHGDVVLEVGCHQGMTTGMLARAVGQTGFALGIDASPFVLERAEALRAGAVGRGEGWASRLAFEACDMRDVGKILKLLASHRPGNCPRGTKPTCDVLFLDVSGNREVRTLVALLDSYDRAIRPRVVVVKSFRMLRLVNRCVLWDGSDLKVRDAVLEAR